MADQPRILFCHCNYARVVPDEVKQVIALAPMTETMLLAASAKASAVVGSGRVSVKCNRAR